MSAAGEKSGTIYRHGYRRTQSDRVGRQADLLGCFDLGTVPTLYRFKRSVHGS